MNWSGRNLLSTLLLILVLLAIPISVLLLRETQVFRSRATAPAVRFPQGPGVEVISDQAVAVDDDIVIEVTSPFGSGASPTNTPTPGQPTNTPTPTGATSSTATVTPPQTTNTPTPRPTTAPTATPAPSWVDVRLNSNMTGTQTLSVAQRTQEFREGGAYSLSGTVDSNGSVSAHVYSGSDTWRGVQARGGGTIVINPGDKFFIVIRAYNEYVNYSNLSLVRFQGGASSSANLLSSNMQNGSFSVTQNIQEFSTPGTYQFSGNVSGAGVILVDVYPQGSGARLARHQSGSTFTITQGQRFFLILRATGDDSPAVFTNVTLRKQQ